VNRRLQILVGVAALVLIALSVGVIAWLRIQESKEFCQAHQVQTYGGTNYMAQLIETTVGKADTGHVVIVYLRLQNPNDYEVALDRNWFILVDGDKDYFQPSTTGTHSPLIKLPPHGVEEKASLSFAVPDDSFAGTIGLQIGQNYWVLIKDQKPFRRKLHSGEFVTFRSRDW
jgi:hypothetical protein